MALPLIPLLGAAALAAIAYAATRKSSTLSDANTEDLAAEFATKGPRGEYVFKPEVAQAILSSLTTQRYHYPQPSSRELAQVMPDPTGRPIPALETARAWVNNLNGKNSILCPLYMATQSNKPKFLRATAAGQEPDFASEGNAYAVLVYAGALGRGEPAPGTAPGAPGGAPATPQGTQPSIPGNLPTPPPLPAIPGTPPPASQDPRTPGGVPPEILAQFQDLLAHGTDPDAMDALADKLDSWGLHDQAAQLRARAAQLRASKPAPGGVLDLPAEPPTAPPRPQSIVIDDLPTVQVRYAKVTTNDPPGPGDLILRETPSATGAQVVNTLSGIRDGGAEKDGIVTVLDWDSDPTFARVAWAGGSRRGPATGWGRKAYLVLTSQAPTLPGGLAVPATFDPSQIPGSLPAPTFDPGLFVNPLGGLGQPAGGDTVAGASYRLGPRTIDANVYFGLSTSPGHGQVPFVYAPSLAPVGSGDRYDPGPVTQDAAALTWLGYPCNPGPRVGKTRGGPFDPAFRAAVAQVQKLCGMKPNGLVTPAVRRCIARLVEKRNVQLGGAARVAGLEVGAKHEAESRRMRVAAPGGLRLRAQPNAAGRMLRALPAGDTVRMLKLVRAEKTDPSSPSQGGWALVDHGGHRGWVMSEWLTLAS